MTLARYLARRFSLSLMMIFLIFMAIVFMVDLIEQLRRLSERADAGLGQAMVLSALRMPLVLYQILPLIIMLASIAYFVALARSSELVAIRAAGRSALRALLPPSLVAFLVGALAVAVFNPVVAMSSRMFEAMQTRIETGEERTLSITADGLWLRQGTDSGQTVIRARRSNADGTLLFGASFLTFTLEGPPTQRIAAARAELHPGEWVLHDAKIWQLNAANPEAEAQEIGRMTLSTDLTPGKIRDSFGSPEVISIWEMRDFIDGLDRAGFASTLHRVWVQKELATPALLAAIVLLAAGFTMRHARFGKTGVMVLSAIMAGFGVFFLRNFAQVLGENGQLPIVLSAWGPPAVAILAALGLLLHQEDG